MMTDAIENPFLATLERKPSKTVPVWFMRQAGRYLPEYREIRSTCSGFLDLCYTPSKAAEVTLQPIRRFGFDAAILFSDILVIPHALGVKVEFKEGEGPQLEPVSEDAHILALREVTEATILARLAPVLETIDRVKQALPPATGFIGFAGAPWTVACYMIEGKASRDFSAARRFALLHPTRFAALLEVLTQASIAYLSAQIRAGVQAVQLFDSWSGVLTEQEFLQYVIGPTTRIVAALRKEFPTTPIIGFPKGAGVNALAYATHTGVQALGCDMQQPLVWIKEQLQPQLVVQGNLDPLLLAYDLPAAILQTRRILSTLRSKPFVFNLGHGILPETPIAHVEAVLKEIRSI